MRFLAFYVLIVLFVCGFLFDFEGGVSGLFIPRNPFFYQVDFTTTTSTTIVPATTSTTTSLAVTTTTLSGGQKLIVLRGCDDCRVFSNVSDGDGDDLSFFDYLLGLIS